IVPRDTVEYISKSSQQDIRQNTSSKSSEIGLLMGIQRGNNIRRIDLD
ncbi:1190_t:CDS:1, partial [Funneliformis geosporum]